MSVTFEREVFTNGWYAESFRPDAGSDPFLNLYAAKRQDVLARVLALPESSRVLDLGGGMGRLAVPLARRHRVTLCDISSDMLAMADTASRRAGVGEGRLSLCRLDATQSLPFASGSFDCAVAADLLVHLPEPLVTLRELRRVLAPQGQLLVDTTNSSPWWTLRYPAYVGRHPRRWARTVRGHGVLPEWQQIVHHHSHGEFLGLLRDAGFRVVEERRYGPRLCPKWFLARCRIQE